MPEILLYNPPALPRPKPLLPLSLLALGAMLEGRAPYRIVNGNVEADAESRIEQAVADGTADVLGISVMPGPQVAHALALSRKLKLNYPSLKIVWGGYFPSLYPEVCLNSQVMDALVLGFGEQTFASLVQAWRSGASLAKIPGLAFRDRRTGQNVRTPAAPVPDPNQLPPLPYHAIDVEACLRPTILGQRTASYHAGYGCPYACNFCAVASVAQGCWRMQRPKLALERIGELIRAFRVDALEMWDNNFFGPEANVRALAEGLKPFGLHWWAQGRVDALASYSDATWRALADSGLAMVFMGAEAGTDEALARLGKGGQARADKTLAVARRFKNYGVIPEFSFVLGFPPDPEGSVRATFAYIRQVKRINPAAEIVLNTFTPILNSSPLFQAAQAWGFKFPETLDDWAEREWQEFSLRRTSHLPWISPRLRRRIKNFERVLWAYYPTAADPRLRPWARRLSRLLSAWRWHSGITAWPWELSLLRRLIPFQRPETSGF